MSLPRPALPSPPIVPGDRLLGGTWTPGRVCATCLAWARRHERLHHEAGCRAGDMR